MKLKPLLAAAAVSLLLAGCGERTPAPDTAEAPPVAVDVAPEAPPAIAAEVPRNDPGTINFEGFGPAKFGADEEQVRMAWGHPLVAGTPAEGASCYYLTMDPMPTGGRGIAFLFEDGGFRRYDVDVPTHVAPGGLVTGMAAEAVEAAFPGRVEAQPHKYVEGARYLVVAPEDGGDARLVFETDAAGTIVSWRIGVPPQIHYVEGCG